MSGASVGCVCAVGMSWNRVALPVVGMTLSHLQT